MAQRSARRGRENQGFPQCFEHASGDLASAAVKIPVNAATKKYRMNQSAMAAKSPRRSARDHDHASDSISVPHHVTADCTELGRPAVTCMMTTVARPIHP